MNVHPELIEILDKLPLRPDNPDTDVRTLRADFRSLMAASDTGVDDRVETQTAAIPGPGGNMIESHIVRPRAATETLPAVLYIHGGGFAYGELGGPSRMARDASVTAAAVVINPHYRLAPEHGFPAGLEDCYAVLQWAHQHARELGIDPTRIAVAGPSAGGCLSAATCLLSRDCNGPPIAFQCLLIPALDDRPITPSRQAITDPRLINGPSVEHTWDVEPSVAHGSADDRRAHGSARASHCSLC